jgi:hypothetical protein
MQRKIGSNYILYKCRLKTKNYFFYYKFNIFELDGFKLVSGHARPAARCCQFLT